MGESKIFESLMAGIEDVTRESADVLKRSEENEKKVISMRSPSDHHVTAHRAASEQPVTAHRSPSDHEQNMSMFRSPSDHYISLTEHQSIIYNWFLNTGLKGRFNKSLINRETDISYITIRRALKRMIDFNIVRVQYDKIRKEFDYEMNPGINVKKSTIRAVHGHDQSMIRAPHYIEEEDIYNLLLEKINVIYPSLHNIGFERSQIQDVIQSWKLNSIDLKDLPESLQRADYAVEHKSFKMNDPLNYVYSALIKGLFRKPTGYKSRAEIQADERLAEQKQISEKNEEAFQLWCENVSPEKRAELCKGIPRIKQSAHLREIFDNDQDCG